MTNDAIPMDVTMFESSSRLDVSVGEPTWDMDYMLDKISQTYLTRENLEEVLSGLSSAPGSSITQDELDILLDNKVGTGIEITTSKENNQSYVSIKNNTEGYINYFMIYYE